jgi:hypothetical protein
LQSAFLAFFFLCDVMLQQQLGSTFRRLIMWWAELAQDAS